MLPVVLKVHPLSRKVLVSQYGTEQIFLRNHDTIFDLLTGQRQRHITVGATADQLVAEITFYVQDRLAHHIQEHAYQIALKLFRHHIQLMRWYAAAQVRALGRGNAKTAILDWMYLHGVDEDDFSSDAAYKSFQRFGWNFDEKNAEFSGHLRRKSAGNLARKMRNRAKLIKPLSGLVINMEDSRVELAAARFLTSYSNTFRRIPAKLPKYAKVYLYVRMQELSNRQAEKKLSMNRTAIRYAIQAMRQRMDKNPTVAQLLEQCIDLPEPAC